MIDFFKKIIPNFNNKKTLNSYNDTINLYLDRKKKTFIKIKISFESTCQEIHSIYHSEILSEISQNFSKNNQNYNNGLGVSGNFPKNFNSKDYNFIIIDDDNKILELKMKENDYPIKYMIKPTINLHYLNTSKVDRKDSFDSELNSYSINNIGRNRKNNYDSYQPKKKSFDQTKDYIIDNNEESIREGDLMKFSNKKKIFERRKVIIDKKKMIIEKKSKNDATIIFLRDIKTIYKDHTNPAIKDSRYLFEITTLEGEKFIFKSKNNADLVSWLETIENLVNIIRDNELILHFEENIRKEIKNINDKGKQILIECLGLRGILSIKESRKIFFKFYDNPIISELIELIINYKINVKLYKYRDALYSFKEIVNFLDIDNLNLSYFNNSIQIDVNSNLLERRRSDIFNKNETVKQKYNPNDIKSLNVIFDSNINTNFNRSKTEINTEQNKTSENSSLNKEEIFDNKLKNEEILIIQNLDEAFTSIIKEDNIESKEKENNENYEKEENKNKNFVLKYILTLDNINNLRSLKSDIKDYFGKYEMKIFEEEWQFLDLNGINQQEQNTKFNEFLKFGIFNDIYENILTKHLNDFYKNIFLDKNFCESLEKILVYYFNLNNNLIENESKVIDFNDVIKMFTVK